MKKSAKKCSFRLNAKLAKNGDFRTNTKLANEGLHLKKAEAIDSDLVNTAVSAVIDRETLSIVHSKLLLTGSPWQ